MCCNWDPVCIIQWSSQNLETHYDKIFFFWILHLIGSARTLRETALESPHVLQLLGDRYVSSWSLVADLEAARDNQTDAVYATLASSSLAIYK